MDASDSIIIKHILLKMAAERNIPEFRVLRKDMFSGNLDKWKYAVRKGIESGEL